MVISFDLGYAQLSIKELAMKYELITQLIFILLPVFCLALIGVGLNRAFQKLAAAQRRKKLLLIFAAFGVWAGILSALSLSGFIADFSSFPPRFVIVVIIPMVAFILLMRFGKLDQYLQEIPPSWLITIQLFRLPVEIGLLLLFLDGVIPEQMTFEGLNFDVLSGVAAPFIAFFAFSGGNFRKKLAIAYNIAGLVLLATIVTIAFISTPTPIRVFMNDPANTAIADFPYVLLPGMLVPIAYYMHGFSLRQLLKK